MVYFKKNLLCSKNSLTDVVGYQQPTCLWSLEPFRVHVNCFHFRAAVFVHVGPAPVQLCTGNGVSFYMCRVKV